MIKKEKTIMLQQVMTNPGEIIFREVPVPEVKENQVLVKIMNIGVCGSDIHVYHGKHPFTKYPVTQGHEVSGASGILWTLLSMSSWKV
jgi:L-iditol 2-dehydrogenase